MKQIKSLLAKSNLTKTEREELFAVLKLLSENELSKLFDFLKAYPEWIEKLYCNYKQKKELAATKDYGKWQKLFDEEEQELRKL